MRSRSYMFTNKRHSELSIMSSVLGVISVISLVLVVFLSYKNEGTPSARYGAVCVLSLVFSLSGIILGVAGRMQRDSFYFFAYLGIALNVAALFIISAILYAGAYL
ncbi:MAG: DUF6142 family protein [Lachnospiraceae bacterium]|nr:DUF6142 family protein [Lachnospiraceae bacterium]